MNPEELDNQMPPQMSPDESAAALSWANGLSEKFLKAQNPPIQSAEPEAQAQAEPEVSIEQTIEEKVREIVGEEMTGLRQTLEQALSDDEAGEEDKAKEGSQSS